MPIINQEVEGLTNYKLTIECPSCGATRTLVVDANKFNRWRAGSLIQRVFPDLPIQDREAMITGICSPCWDRSFSNMENGEGE